MNLILLGGNSPKNKTWIEDVADTLSDLFDEVAIQYYDHWETGGSMKMNREQDRLQEITDAQDGPYAIFAKSAGAILAIESIIQQETNPEICFFVGAPLGASAPERLGNFRTPTLFIQQTDDPYRPAKKLRNVLENSQARNWELRSVPGDDHIYSNIDTIKKYINEFFSSSP